MIDKSLETILSSDTRESILLFSIRLNSLDNFGSLKFTILSFTISNSLAFCKDNPFKGMGGREGRDCQYFNHF